MTINLEGDKYDTLASRIVDDNAPELPGYVAANLCDAIAAQLRADGAEIERLRRQLCAAQEWYWPADDTSSEACMEDPWEYVREHFPGEVVAISCGGVVWTRYFAYLPPAEDADSDDDFEVDADTREEAEQLVKAEMARRDALTETADA